jgi:xanthine/uracil permease
MTKRLLYYLLLVGLTIVTPYLTTMVCIIATGDRYEGMTTAVIPGIIIVHLVFGLIAVKLNWTGKLLWTVLLSAIIFGLVILLLRLELIKTNFDLYGFWDIALSNLIAGLIVWTSFFQIHQKLTKQKYADT